MMSDRNEFQSFLEPEEAPSSLSKEVFTEIPAPLPPQIKKALTGFSPMEQIELEGQAYRGFASGQMPWLIVLTGWVVFVAPFLVMIFIVITSQDLTLLPAVAIAAMPVWIVCRGTQAKLASDGKRNRAKAQRQSRRRQAMRE